MEGSEMAQEVKKWEKENVEGNEVRPFGMKDKIGYLFGDFGNDFFFILVASFLMVYYTDVYGLNPAFVGICRDTLFNRTPVGCLSRYFLGTLY
jgi:GPH family glycoside/pentoside/hexuronide:cation symporter